MATYSELQSQQHRKMAWRGGVIAAILLVLGWFAIAPPTCLTGGDLPLREARESVLQLPER